MIATIECISADEIPYLAPEIYLLYKAKGSRPKDEADFMHTLPAVDQERRQWLKKTLATAQPHHPWRILLWKAKTPGRHGHGKSANAYEGYERGSGQM